MFSVIARGIAAASKPVIQRLAPMISKLVKRPVTASASSITGAIKGWAGNNKGKLMLAAHTAASAGVGIVVDDLMESAGPEMASNPSFQALMSATQQLLSNERQLITGDGNASTIHGVPAEQYHTEGERQDQIYAVIVRGARAAGSMTALKQIRAAVLMEDADYDMVERRQKFLAKI